MKKFVTATLASACAASFAMAASMPANADDHMKKMDTKAETPVPVERNARGKVTKVRIGDKVYDVCMTFEQDSCINPRAAGLNWGNRPLGYWPGKPASEM